MSITSTPSSKFVKVKCNECEEVMIVFNHAKTVVNCAGKNCDEVIATPLSGKAEIHGEIIETLE